MEMAKEMKTYTLTEALALPAGRDLDACVAEHVFEWIKEDRSWHGRPFTVFYPKDLPGEANILAWTLDDKRWPHYSTSWADAGPLLEVMSCVKIYHDKRCNDWICFWSETDCKIAETPQLAICRAALVWASERGKKL